jgi:hypothetical protein
MRREEELEVVPASYSSHSLVFLDKFTEYSIQILAFNPAGDGPPSTPITVKTLQVRYSAVHSRLPHICHSTPAWHILAVVVEVASRFSSASPVRFQVHMSNWAKYTFISFPALLII